MAQSTTLETRVLTVREVSEYLRVHPSTVYRLLRQRQLPAFRVGSDWRFNVEAIDRWRAEMEKSVRGGTSEMPESRGKRGPGSHRSA
jgi:excisionase family DNA binding protein